MVKSIQRSERSKITISFSHNMAYGCLQIRKMYEWFTKLTLKPSLKIPSKSLELCWCVSCDRGEPCSLLLHRENPKARHTLFTAYTVRFRQHPTHLQRGPGVIQRRCPRSSTKSFLNVWDPSGQLHILGGREWLLSLYPACKEKEVGVLKRGDLEMLLLPREGPTGPGPASWSPHREWI
jgi:hypothetical protein